ncbi:unnamed protein product, partial [Amoebophrya sp. A120]
SSDKGSLVQRHTATIGRNDFYDYSLNNKSKRYFLTKLTKERTFHT